MNTTPATTGQVQATAPNGQVFSKAAVLRGYTVRAAVLGRTGDTWAAVSWCVDLAAADRKVFSPKVQNAYDEVIVVEVAR
jgi:hypothetical protein